MPLGATQESLLEKLPEFSCDAIIDGFEDLGDVYCHGTSSYAGVEAFASVYFYSNSLGSVRITFDSDEFDDVNRALMKKYGQPTTAETTVLGNAMGAKFVNETNTWKRKGGKLSINKFAGEISESSVDISSTDYSAEYAKRKKRSINEKGGDL